MLSCPKCTHQALIAEFAPMFIEVPMETGKKVTYECPACKWAGTEDEMHRRGD